MQGYRLPFDDLMGFQEVVFEMPLWWFDGLLLWLAALGLLLWFLGRRVIRPVFALIGAAAGAVALVLVGQALGFGEPLWYWAAGGALVGALVLGLLFWRLLLALIVTLAVGALAPWVVIQVWGWDGPPVQEPLVRATQQIQQLAETRANAAAPNAEVMVEAGEETEPPPESITQIVEQAWIQVAEGWNEWWTERELHQQGWLIGAAVGGGVLALLFSLALPGVVAALLTAFVGTGLVMLGLWRLGALYAPEASADWTPTDPAILLAILAVGMVLGAAVQWVLLRPRGAAEA